LSLLNEKTEFILSSEIVKIPALTITEWGETGKAIFVGYHISFFRALSKNFSGKDGSGP